MTTLMKLQDLLTAQAVTDIDAMDPWNITVNSKVIRVTAVDPAFHPDPADAFAAASSLVDQILALGYKLAFTNTISANSPYGDGDPITFRGTIDIGLQPATD